MIIDARKLPKNTVINGKICIVGAGAAGITLAKELSPSFSDIILLESGGKQLEIETQDLYKGEILDPNHGALHEQRQRQLGGTTNVWGGRCAPFDSLDFTARSYVPNSGWPLSKKDLDPYYKQAHNYCELGRYSEDIKTVFGADVPEMIPGWKTQEISTDQLWLFSPPTNFKNKYQTFLKQTHKVTTYLHANCLQIKTNQEGTHIDHLQCASLAKNYFIVRAETYILAMGCLEITRLLLLSNIGNQNDLLGRFYMGHISGDVGNVTFTPRQGNVIWDYEKTRDGVYARRSIRITPETQQKYQLMNLRAILTYPEISDPSHGNSILSAMYIIKTILLLRQTSRIYYSKNLDTSGFNQTVNAHLKNVLGDLPNLGNFSYRWLTQRIFSSRQLPSVVLESQSNTYTLHFDAEQSPNYCSRVMLGNEVDAFGLKRLRVDWRYTESDLQNVIQSYQVIANSLETAGVGKLEFNAVEMPDRIKENLGVGSHHIGTTRMSDSPQQGVVDKNCKVHGIDNLYLASSSVFPTSSYANPTLTILALTLRLAAHLKQFSSHPISYSHPLLKQ
ncbi:GMC oxidoreductase [Halothece sp. PCC 7418]|uniref:GMC oxidoreductase n=1 Tax=Halothece sp. (strain PCC 7418) TaxID=65093 RepID=UPI0002A0732C|nr:GMC oxidoreductase [Halothece sp. PCC 7418]AFZ44029.1 GMC oxidoreductase [Halothece sp. PCC 7418]